MRTIPASTANAPPSWRGAAALPNASQPTAAPTTGSRLTKAPASAAGTRVCANANNQNGSSVPASTSAATATIVPAAAGDRGVPPVRRAKGRARRAAAAN
ncbi:MAG TPA: hypothetical protein VE127_03190 [Solirubrobacteraceae bacterium]|nr:hypothetical protein [Solirubrobacteraceae bacterium]